jgi:glycosyltransferase involved in cell wall biosynthesis
MTVELVSHLPKDSVSGIGRYVKELHKHLQDQIDIKITQGVDPPLSVRFPILHNFPISVKDHLPGSIVHFMQIMGCAQMLWRPYHPSVATVHDLGALELPEEWQMLDPIARQVLRLSLAGLNRVDLIVAVSEFSRNGVIKHLACWPERVVTIHQGIDYDTFRPIPNARESLLHHYSDLQKHANAPWLLYVGSELPRKNVRTLLEAMTFLRQKMPNIRLIKVGSAGGDQFRQETMRSVKELGLDDYIYFFDDVPEDELPGFYSAADLFITASKLEGFGFPVLEAMACGVPVVCSTAGSLPEIAGEAAKLIHPNDTQGFVEAIFTLLRNSSLADQMIQLGFQNAQKFNWRKTAERTAMVYDTLLSGSPISSSKPEPLSTP